MLDIYTDYLICSFGQASATGLARLLSNEISHDAVTRFLASEPKTSAALWHVVKPLVRQVEQDDGVIIIDDSIEEKPSTDENELVSWHYDHSKDRTVKGINFLTALYHASAVSLPAAFDLVTKTVEYFDPKTKKCKRKSALTKNERYRMLLRVAVHNQVRFKYVLNDVWFASSDNMKFVKHQLGKEFVMPLKENRKVAVSGEAKKRGQYMAVNMLEVAAATTQQIWAARRYSQAVYGRSDYALGHRRQCRRAPRVDHRAHPDGRLFPDLSFDCCRDNRRHSIGCDRRGLRNLPGMEGGAT